MKENDVTQLLISELERDGGANKSKKPASKPTSEMNHEEMAEKTGTAQSTTPAPKDETFADLSRRVAAAEPKDALVPSLAGKYKNETSKTNPAPNVRLQDDLNMWKDRIGISAGRGLAGSRLTNTLMGYNHRIVSNPLPVNREAQTLVFQTRPDMNLNVDNVANSRRFSDMVAQDRSSIDYSIIAALDPLSPYTNSKGEGATMGAPCFADVPFDNLQAFIPMLASHISNFSGIPDGSVDNWMSDEGIKREQYGMADSTHLVNYAYSVSTTYNNMIGDPIMRMASLWLEWMSGVKEGRFRPRISNSIQRRIDYQSRAYLIRFDPLGKIQRFTCTGAMWPQNDNAGSMSTFDRSKSMTADDSTISLQWQAIGARINDPLYMDAFNKTVAMFNPDMISDPNSEEYLPIGKNYLRKLESSELMLFNYYGYPHIDIIRRRLEWYVYQVDYEFVMKRAGLL